MILFGFTEVITHNFTPEHRRIGGTQIWEVRAAKVAMLHPWSSGTPNFMKTIATHELGHGFGLLNETFPAQTSRSIMGIADQITQCDTDAIKRVYCPTPTPEPTPDGCYLPLAPEDETTKDETQQLSPTPGDCPDYSEWDPQTCSCTPWNPPNSPVVLDIEGDGIPLTSEAGGVYFDLNSDGAAEHLSWTSAGTDDAWLALDKNRNGTIDNGRELFGNYTSQPPSPNRNGFLALKVWDRLSKGGNNDGWIDSADAVFTDLRLWQDVNHNGTSEQNELHSLASLDVARLDLDYQESRRTDQYGNQFKYRARVRDAQGAQVGRWAWDVFLVLQP